MKKEVINIGFDPKKEEIYLGRLEPVYRRANLDQELKTQLAEDFGLLEFTIKYSFDKEGRIVDSLSGQGIVELTARGGVDQETESIKKIEQGLRDKPQKTWVHFSPKNENLGYPSNCVDFWRIVDDKVVWNRVVVKENFEDMNNIRSRLSGEKKVVDENEILALPVGVNLKIAEILDWFEMGESKNMATFETIKKVVEKYVDEFDNEFGSELTSDRELIFRLYSICFKAIKNKEKTIDRGVLEKYMYSVLSSQRQEKSFGCSVTTTVGIFGEKIGYYITTDGQVKYGEIPKDYKECDKCGCWYFGDKCPFC